MNEDNNYQKQQKIKKALLAKINIEVKEMLIQQFNESTEVWEKDAIISITQEQGYKKLALSFKDNLL